MVTQSDEKQSPPESYLDKMARLALQDKEKLSDDALLRQVRFMMSCVERDTRHKAGDLAQKLLTDIHNMRLA